MKISPSTKEEIALFAIGIIILVILALLVQQKML